MNIRHVLKLLIIIVAVFFAGFLTEEFIEQFPAHTISARETITIVYEIFPILMEFSIFAMIWFSYDKNKNNHSLFMGMAFLIIGLVDLCHMLSYPYMPNLITPNSVQKAAVFHSEARLISGILFLASAYIYKDTLPKLINKSILLIFVIILFFISFVLPLFYLNRLPILYSDSVTPTALIIRQFISSVLILYASYLYIKRYQRTGERYIISLIYGFIILIFSDLLYFTYQLPGHLLRVAAYFFLYLALYRSSVELPYEKLAVAEEKLRQAAEEKYRSLVQTANDAIISEDNNGIIVSWNRGAQTIFGYTENEVLGKSLTILMPERYKEDHRKGFERFRSTGESEYIGKMHEFYGKRKDGTEFPLELSTTAWRTGEGIFYTGIIRDITERKQAEERLHLFRNLMDRSNDAIFVDDPETARILYTNDRACRNLGYTREELLNIRVFDIETTIPNYSSWKEHINEIKKKGYLIVEGLNRRKDGTLLPVEVNTSYIDIGKNSYTVAVVRDITERKRAEEELRRAYGELELRVKERTAELAKTNEALKTEIEERKRIEAGLHLFRNLIDQFNDALYVADAKTGWLLDVNYRACYNLGYSREELLNMSVMDVDAMVPDYLSWQKNAAEIREKGSIIFEGKHRRKDGTIFPVEVSIRFIVQDKKEYIVGVARDITERKRIEEELRRSIRQLNAILTNIPDIAWLKDKESRFIAVNKPFADTAGVTPEYLVGKTDFDIWPKELAESYMADDREVMATGRRKQVVEPLVDKEGKRTWIETIKTPIYDYKGEVIGTTGISRDITERKRMEEEREKWTAELARSNAELEQFAYIASHDLQEPLRMVSGFTQLLAGRYKDRLDKDADEFITYIMDGTTRMQRMIEDLLAYSRVGTRGKSFEPTDLEGTLDQAVTNLKVSIEENKAVVTHDPLPTAMADASQMVQLFQNLISNAIKFRKDEQPRIHISAQRKGDDWVFSVEDNGIGISPEFMGHLFQIFQREHAASKYPGTGIGLAICKRIVERHGGRIWAESVLGRGSIFYFTIPARKGNQ